MKFLASLAIVFLPAIPAWSQDVVEHAVISGASAAGAGPASALGKSLGGILTGVGKNLDKAPKATDASPAAPAAAPAAAQASAPNPDAAKATSGATAAKPFVPRVIDPAQVSIGLDRDGLLEKCGPPLMKVSQKKDSTFVETYWYETAPHAPFVVTLRDGKVAAFTPPAK